MQRRLKHYNLDASISVGYRVNSKRAVAFRQWAIAILRQHLTQGYTLNRQRLEDNARELGGCVLSAGAATVSFLRTRCVATLNPHGCADRIPP